MKAYRSFLLCVLTGAAATAVLLCATVQGADKGTPRDPSTATATATATATGPAYTAAGELQFPKNYREWIYLSTGFDMSYSGNANPSHHMFDNVFVEPAAYREFMRTGSWPDGTMMVLEVRGARDKGSINKSGHFQDEESMGVEVHVRDTARFADKWAFFSFDDGKAAGRLQPQSADCYACHAAHAAVDTTFVQFYPTLLPVARAKGTLSAVFTAEEAAAH